MTSADPGIHAEIVGLEDEIELCPFRHPGQREMELHGIAPRPGFRIVGRFAFQPGRREAQPDVKLPRHDCPANGAERAARFWPLGTISGVPESGSVMTRQGRPKTSSTSSAVTISAGLPWAMIAPSSSR